MTLGEKITIYRKNKYYTQEELAKIMNVSRQTIYKWEANLAIPKMEKLKKLTEVLGVNYNDLLQ